MLKKAWLHLFSSQRIFKKRNRRSTNSNFKKDKCWPCEYFCGKRDYKRDAFLVDSVYTDGKGTCSNKRSDKYNREVYEDGCCSRYQKWGVLQSALAVEAQKREM